MALQNKQSFFSVSYQLINIDKPLAYDLYVNSSSLETKEKFVRIYPIGETLSSEDINGFKKKYPQLFVSEAQRKDFLKSLTKGSAGTKVQKASIIKDSAIQYLEKIFDKDREMTNEVLAETIEGCKESVNSMIKVISDLKIKDLQGLIADLSFHDFYTYDHSINVAMYSISILKNMKPHCSHKEQMTAGLGGLLHDLGKTKIPTEIINSTEKLTESEFEVIKSHPGLGAKLFKRTHDQSSEVDFETVYRVIFEHHENYNGSGYPKGLKKDEIHLYARITAIADFYDAVTTKRSYHEVMSTEDALGVMARSAGKKIDPNIFEKFVESVDVILNAKSHVELPDDFDPCQPCKVLPLEELRPRVLIQDVFHHDEEKEKKKKAS